MIFRKPLAFAACLLFFVNGIFSQSAPDEEGPQSQPVVTQPDFRHGVIALGEISTFNILMTSFNKVVLGKIYSDIDLSTIHDNLSNPWVWDNDEFSINMIGHPYQGAMYHTIARANGFNFWQSLLFSTYGSVTWEYFMEQERQSVNDVITTVINAGFFGEVLHRLSWSVKDYFPFGAFVIDPQAGINKFITGQSSPKPKGDLLHFSIYPLFGYEQSFIDAQKNSGVEEQSSLGTGAGVDAVYGSKYSHYTQEPFDQFQFSSAVITNFSYYILHIFADAALWSTGIVPLEDYGASLALRLHYDVIFGNDVNFQNSAVGFGFMQSIPFAGSWKFNWDANLNLSFLTGSDYYYLLKANAREDPDGLEQRLYDFGVGGNAEVELSIEQEYFGRLSIYTGATYAYTLPWTVPTEGSDGWSIMWYGRAQYEHKIYGHISAGASYYWYKKIADYEKTGTVNQFNHVASAFFKWSFK